MMLLPTKLTEQRRRTILQVVPALVSGGVERGTIEIARHLKESGYNSLVISAGGPMLEMLLKHNITHIKLNVASKNPLVIWRNAKLISKVITEYQVDLVHARSRAPAWSCYMAAKACGTKFITTCHGIYNISGPLKRYYNSIMTKGEQIIAVSDFVKQYILTNYAAEQSRIQVIHRGVNHQYFNSANLTLEKLQKFRDKYNIRDQVPVILLPSRMTEWKGHMVLIKALNKIKHLDFCCLMVGDLSKHPNFTNRVQNLIKQTKLQSKIQIFGHELNMLGLYGIADLVLSTSIAPEAFGRTIIEGQSMGKLVISTNIGGAAETILDQSTGFHVQVNNPDDLADKIAYCLSILGSNHAQIITNQARQSVIEHFSLDQMLHKTLSLYQQIL